MSKAVKNENVDLTQGSVPGGILAFAIPVFFGQLLQQFYNMVDAWVIGNFADNDAFAAVASTATIVFLIIGFFAGIAVGGGVIISRYYGAKDEENVVRSIHTNFLMAIWASIIATVVGIILAPHILVWMGTPDSVMHHALMYLRIYFAGVPTVILYNVCMSIMRALGDSLHPLYYLLFSSIVNIVLDLLFVVHPAFKWGVAGTAVATVISQGLSVILCMFRMCRMKDYTRFDFRKIHYYPGIMMQVLRQGLPSGFQNALITLGNLVIQKNVNSFGAYAMSGYGAYSKIEGFVFLPVMSMSMALPTFISQNLGAKEYERAKKGAAFGIAFGVIASEVIGILIFFFARFALRIFVDTPEAIEYGMIHARTVALFFFLMAICHCVAGVLRGCGRAVIPMASMFACWCGIRIIYVTLALQVFPVFRTIALAYPITWGINAVFLLLFLLKSDWVHYYEKHATTLE